jgi:hypothetical protein
MSRDQTDLTLTARKAAEAMYDEHVRPLESALSEARAEIARLQEKNHNLQDYAAAIEGNSAEVHEQNARLKGELAEAQRERDAAHAHACESSLEERNLRQQIAEMWPWHDVSPHGDEEKCIFCDVRREAVERYGEHGENCLWQRCQLQQTQQPKDGETRLEQKRPLPPDVLADALQDRPHIESGRLLAARTIKVQPKDGEKV